METSAKMNALIEQLLIAKDVGDKTIVYSQCKTGRPLLSRTNATNQTGNDGRDVDARLARDVAGVTRHPELMIPSTAVICRRSRVRGVGLAM